MKFIKKYANFITESNLIKEDNQYVDVKMFLNGTKLTIKSNDKSADINLEVPKKLSFSKSFVFMFEFPALKKHTLDNGSKSL